MAKMNLELPSEIIKQLQEIEQSKMLEEMVEAGAKVVKDNITNNITDAFQESENLLKTLRTTRIYRTRSDGAINQKIAFYGYFINRQGKKVPAPLVVQAREYGTSRGEAKKPFIRKAFNKSQIEKAMMQVQKGYIKDEQQ